MNSRVIPILKGAVLALVVAGSITGCGSSNSGSAGSAGPDTPKATVISTNDQGAQATWAGVNGAEAIATLGVRMSGLIDTSSATISSLPILAIPVTFDCTSRQPVLGSSAANSITVVKDPFTGVITATVNACAVGAATVTGMMTLASSNGVSTLTLGATAAPLVVNELTAAGSATVTSKTGAAATVTYSISGATDTLGVTGSIERWDYVRHTHDLYNLNNVSIIVAKSTAVIGTDNYDVATVTAYGDLTRTAYVSDVNPAVGFTQTGSLVNFVVVQRTPAAGSTAIYKYLSINSEYTVASTPSVCIDGDFVVATTADVQIDTTTGMPVAGELTVNTDVISAYNADGSLSVSLNGGAAAVYSAAALGTLCPV